MHQRQKRLVGLPFSLVILELIRVGGGAEVHADEREGKPLCLDRAYEAVVATWEGDSSEITCPKCRKALGLG